jgi:hypothetical protein
VAGEGRTPNTRNARVTEPDGRRAPAGTGQHTESRVTPTGGPTFGPRNTDSPSKTTGKQPSFSNTRRGESSGTDLQPPSVEQNAKMVKDSGAKTERERTFTRINAEIRAKLDGTEDRSMYPTQLERQRGDFARDDKYTGSKPGYRPLKAQ